MMIITSKLKKTLLPPRNDNNNDDETSLSLSTKYEYIIKYNVNVYKHSTIQYAFKMFKKKCEVVAPS